MSQATGTEARRNGAPPRAAGRREPGRVAEALQHYWAFTLPGSPLLEPTPATGPDPYGNPDPEWMRIDWGEHLRTAQVDTDAYDGATAGGTPINYVEMGPTEEERGGPIVFVHGLAGCWQNWLENIPYFARHHRVIALDLPGFGHSPLPSWTISIESHGRVLLDFCEELGVHGSTLVGNSMGGFIAAEAVIRDQDRFERLVLVSAAGITHASMRRGPTVTAARMSLALTPAILRLQNQALRRPALRRQFFGSIFHNPLKIRRELLYEFVENGTGTEGFVPAIAGLAGYDFLDSLEDVELPTLIVWGRNDRIVPTADSDGYSQRIRNSRVVIYDRCGHVPMAERPVRFNRELEEFVSEDL